MFEHLTKAETIVYLNHLLVTMTLCTPRLLMIFRIAPFFNPQVINGVARNCVTLVFALIVFPTVLPAVQTQTLSLTSILAIIIKEAVIGALIGYLVSLFFFALEAVGSILDYQRGASIAASLNPATGTQASPMGHFFFQVAIILFFSAGGLLLFLSGLYESYRVWPIISAWPQPDPAFAQFFLNKLDEMMATAFLLASPILIALFLSEFGLGLINRFAPQLNVFFLSMPIKSAVGILLLIFYMKFILIYFKNGFVLKMNAIDMLKQVVR